MAKRCLIETCKREAETYCYHCSRDVCTKHYLEHQSWIQEQLHPLVDEMNLIYDRLRHGKEKATVFELQCVTIARKQLEKWREECHHQIDTTYDRVQKQMQTIVDTHQFEESQRVVKNLETLEKLRQQLRELLKEENVTYRQLEMIKQQLEDIKRKEQEPIKYPNIRIISQKIDSDKCINVTTDVKHSNEKSQQPKDTPRVPLNRNLSVLPQISGRVPFQQTTKKCPMCSEIFSSSMTMTDRTMHINEHLPD